MKEITGAVVRQKGGPFKVEKLTLDDCRPEEVLVKVVATGMCHTDMVARDQLYDVPLPIVLGHEGAGMVEAVGSSVKKVAVGDHVVLTYMWCGHCKPCLRGDLTYCENFYPLNFGGAREDGSTATHEAGGGAVHDHFFGQSSFGTFALVHERNVIRVPRDAPLELLGPLGCGIQTGAGAVMNALKVTPGSSFAAFGGGAVGLSAVMAARVAGATTIIAADVVPSRLELAKELGATHPSIVAKPIRWPRCVKLPGAAPISRLNPAAGQPCCVRPSTRLQSAVRAASSAHLPWAPRRASM